MVNPLLTNSGGCYTKFEESWDYHMVLFDWDSNFTDFLVFVTKFQVP